MSKNEPPLCARCNLRHWRFFTCEEAAEKEKLKPVPELTKDWSERPLFKSFTDREQVSDLFGGAMTLLPKKNDNS